MRTIFIGDVHGLAVELETLIGRLALVSGDRVIFVGDIVDKGPNSLGALRFVRALIERFPGSACVAGNHEEKTHRQALKGPEELAKLIESGKAEPWTAQATPDDWTFIKGMPLMWHDPAINIRVVHGGIFPALLEKQPDTFARVGEVGASWHKGGGKVMDRARRVLRTRYVGGPDRETGRGEMLELGTNGPGDPFWAETWKGPETVIYGHSPWLNGTVRVDPFAMGIDTAGVFGGKLTALVVTAPGVFETVQVDALKRYAEPKEEPE